MKLSNLATATLGLYIGFKPSYRVREAQFWGIDFVVGAKALHDELPNFEKLSREQKVAIFTENAGKRLGSQTHQYMRQLGFISDLDRRMNNPMQQLDELTIR